MSEETKVKIDQREAEQQKEVNEAVSALLANLGKNIQEQREQEIKDLETQAKAKYEAEIRKKDIAKHGRNETNDDTYKAMKEFVKELDLKPEEHEGI